MKQWAVAQQGKPAVLEAKGIGLGQFSTGCRGPPSGKETWANLSLPVTFVFPGGNSIITPDLRVEMCGGPLTWGPLDGKNPWPRGKATYNPALLPPLSVPPLLTFVPTTISAGGLPENSWDTLLTESCPLCLQPAGPSELFTSPVARGSSATAGGGPYGGLRALEPSTGMQDPVLSKGHSSRSLARSLSTLKGGLSGTRGWPQDPASSFRHWRGKPGCGSRFPFSAAATAVGEGACPPRLAKTEINQLIKMAMRWPENIWNMWWIELAGMKYTVGKEEPDLLLGVISKHFFNSLALHQAASWDSGFVVSLYGWPMAPPRSL